MTTFRHVARVAATAGGDARRPPAPLDRQVRQYGAVALDARYAQEAREKEPGDAGRRAGPSAASALRLPVAAAELVVYNAPSHVEDADAILMPVRLHEEQVQRVELRSRRAQKAGPALIPVLGLGVCQGSAIVTAWKEVGQSGFCEAVSRWPAAGGARWAWPSAAAAETAICGQ